MLNAKVSGDGLALVFLHGFGEDHTIWDNLTQNLSLEYKTVAIDLPGFGKSTRINSPFSLDDIADILHRYLTDSLNIQQYIIFGHSLGGYISLALAEKFSSNILGFGLINSTSLADNPTKKNSREKTISFINKHGASFFLNSFVPNLFYSKNISKLQDKIENVLQMGQNLDTSVLTSYMLAMKDRPDRQELLRTYMYVLFIGGHEDSQFSIEDYNTQISLLQNPDNGIILPKIAHMSMYEAPNSLFTVIKDFLESIKNDRN